MTINEKPNCDNVKPNHYKILRILLICLGTLSLGLGILGIFLPLLPTTPFLLLAATLYAKSSERFYNWLIGNKVFGTYIKNYREGKGIPLRAKILSLSLMWTMMLYSTFFIVENIFIRIILMLIAVCVSIHILRMKTIK